MNLPNALKQLRINTNISQLQAAAGMGISQPEISQFETGVERPSPRMLKRYSEFYNIPEPIIFFMALDEDDVPENDREYYRSSRPYVDDWVKEIFIVEK